MLIRVCHVGALIIRIGLGGILHYSYFSEFPQNPIPLFTLHWGVFGFMPGCNTNRKSKSPKPVEVWTWSRDCLKVRG